MTDRIREQIEWLDNEIDLIGEKGLFRTTDKLQEIRDSLEALLEVKETAKAFCKQHDELSLMRRGDISPYEQAEAIANKVEEL